MIVVRRKAQQSPEELLPLSFIVALALPSFVFFLLLSYFFVVLGNEPSTLHMLGKHSQPLSCIPSPSSPSEQTEHHIHCAGEMLKGPKIPLS